MTAYRTIEDHGNLTFKINFKVTPETGKRIDDLARAEGRSRSDCLRRLLAGALEGKGDPEKKKPSFIHQADVTVEARRKMSELAYASESMRTAVHDLRRQVAAEIERLTPPGVEPSACLDMDAIRLHRYMLEPDPDKPGMFRLTCPKVRYRDDWDGAWVEGES